MREIERIFDLVEKLENLKMDDYLKESNNINRNECLERPAGHHQASGHKCVSVPSGSGE